MAQTGTDLVEVEPIKCWWRTSTSAVRTGEAFDLRLTCAVVETEAAKVVADLSKLDPTVVQLPPFEVTGGTHAGDLVSLGRRFFQYDYRLRLIAEDAFGADVAVPPLEVTYRVESKVTGGDSVQGRELSYSLPRASVRLISVVPDDTSDIREAPASAFSAVEARDARAGLFQTIAGVLFALARVMAVVILIGMLRSKTKATSATRAHLAPRALLRPRLIQPGDPVIRVKTDPSVTEVFVVLPFGETLPLKYLESEGVWETRFLAPVWMADGTYNCRLLLTDKNGNGYEEKKSFVVDSQAPKLNISLDRKSFMAGDEIALKVSADADAHRITAKLYGAQPADIRWSNQERTNVGTLRIPESLASGRYTLTVSAEDFAHNQSSREIQIEVIGK